MLLRIRFRPEELIMTELEEELAREFFALRLLRKG